MGRCSVILRMCRCCCIQKSMCWSWPQREAAKASPSSSRTCSAMLARPLFLTLKAKTPVQRGDIAQRSITRCIISTRSAFPASRKRDLIPFPALPLKIWKRKARHLLRQWSWDSKAGYAITGHRALNNCWRQLFSMSSPRLIFCRKKKTFLRCAGYS